MMITAYSEGDLSWSQGGENHFSKSPGDEHEVCLSQGWSQEKTNVFFSPASAFLKDAPHGCCIFIF